MMLKITGVSLFISVIVHDLSGSSADGNCEGPREFSKPSRFKLPSSHTARVEGRNTCVKFYVISRKSTTAVKSGNPDYPHILTHGIRNERFPNMTEISSADQ